MGAANIHLNLTIYEWSRKMRRILSFNLNEAGQQDVKRKKKQDERRKGFEKLKFSLYEHLIN